MQIIFIFDASQYYNSEYKKPIYILNPMKLKSKDLFIKYILCSKVTKIFHGSDSLDYPHIFTDILKQDKKQFIKFVNHSIDTRFMCELSKRIMQRAGVLDIRSNKCSIYNALFDHKIINKDMFDNLEAMSSKINYHKPWIIEKLTENQIKYSAYDVIYLYDLVHMITKIIKPISENKVLDCDPISVIDRLYRYHMLNRLNIIDISMICKNTNTSSENDDKIMETYLMTVNLNMNDQVHKIDLMVEDFLFIDTIRKSILNCLRVYGNNKSLDKFLDKSLGSSEMFNMMKGNETIKKLMDIIKIKTEHNSDIVCNK
jgi:hypothetical protein